MEEAECYRRGESKILNVFVVFIIVSFLVIPYSEKQHSYQLLTTISCSN